jgi:hypothetical protein
MRSNTDLRVSSAASSGARAHRRGWLATGLPFILRDIGCSISTAATSAASGASPRASNTASSASKRRHHLDRDRAVRRHEGERYRPRGLKIRHRGIPRGQVPLHGRHRPLRDFRPGRPRLLRCASNEVSGRHCEELFRDEAILRNRVDLHLPRPVWQSFYCGNNYGVHSGGHHGNSRLTVSHWADDPSPKGAIACTKHVRALRTSTVKTRTGPTRDRARVGYASIGGSSIECPKRKPWLTHSSTMRFQNLTIFSSEIPSLDSSDLISLVQTLPAPGFCK